MAKAKKEIDLKGTHYDALETSLTQQLGLKVFLVRGWEGAGALDQASAQLQFAKTQEAWEAARENYNAAREAVIASLRANIAERDPALGAEITDNELLALRGVSHVTLRTNNVEQETAVILFDPVSTPAKSVAVLSFSDADGHNKSTVNLTEGGPLAQPELPKEAALYMALSPVFDNLWQHDSEDRSQRKVLVENFAENFDIDIEDLRRYKALVNIRYALRNQNEHANKFKRDQPGFLNFAGIENDGTNYLDRPYYKRWYRDVFNEVAAIDKRYGTIEDYGFKDPQFFEKLKLAGAVMNLAWTNLTPNNTFARLKQSHKADDKVIEATMRDLGKRIKENIEQKFPEAFDFSVMQDWRMLFPIFREVYEVDKSGGVQREYLDTIMQGLQKWFPTLTNGPVPAYDYRKPEGEPARELANYAPVPAHNLPKAKKKSAPKSKPA
jgi:hypothetical protein